MRSIAKIDFLRRRLLLLWKLGLRNVLRVLLYRLGLKYRLHPVCHISSDSPKSPFFSGIPLPPQKNVEVNRSPGWWLFGWYEMPLEGEPPDWFYSIQKKKHVSFPDSPWWKIPDFSDEVGDIKAIWELSRFDWVTLLALRARKGCPAALERLDEWLSDWLRCNPPYRGPNWKCGQEASIRVIHLAFAALVLESTRDTSGGLQELIRVHLKRIRPTLSYALGQSNNHGTSEAAAMFIGGSWLWEVAGDRPAGNWAKKGREVLEERTRTLFAPDGSFSQYSTNYHRMALSTICAAETWRRHMGLPAFSDLFYKRGRAATDWLASFVSPVNGDAPNLGANDGSRLLPLSGAGFRDNRPEIEWACNLFHSGRMFPAAERHDTLSRLFAVPTSNDSYEAPSGSAQFDSGGYSVVRSGRISCFLRYPRYHFRPRHADSLHLDLWRVGVNWLRDAGSYSYNTETFWESYFPSTAAHNTVQFDGRDQMPQVGRFLRSDWLAVSGLMPVQERGGTVTAGAAYRDWKGARHQRTVALNGDKLRVFDRIRGFSNRAVLRWRLPPSEWRCSGQMIETQDCSVSVTTDLSIDRFELVEGWESRYYLQMSTVSVLEIEVSKPGLLITEVCFR